MKRIFIGLVLLAGAELITAPAVTGATFPVTNIGEFESALAAAKVNGEDNIITVAAGTYNVTTTLTYDPVAGETGSLTIIGEGAATTILDGGGSLQVLNLQGDGDIMVSGLTVTNGNDLGSGGGILGFSSGTFTLSDTTVSNSTADDIGGGAQIGGLNIVISNSTFSSNTATRFDGGGAELFCSGGSLSISNTTISGNTAGRAGGGININSCPVVSITHSTFTGNSMGRGLFGGGLFVDQFDPNGSVTVTDSVFTGNMSSGPCGGASDTGVGLSLSANGPVTFSRNLVDGNTTTCPGDGAGMLLEHNGSTGTVIVSDNIFSRNASGPGSPFAPVTIVSFEVPLNVVNNTFSGNDSGDGATDDILLELFGDTATLSGTNNIFWGGPGNDQLLVETDGNNNATDSTGTLSYNIFDPTKATIGAGISQSNNLNVDPAFADAPGGDFHITENSPAIDTGLDSAPGIQTLDFDGDLRIYGITVDRGADEFRLPPTFNPQTDKLNFDEVQLVSNGNLRFDNAGVKAYAVEMTRLDQAGYVFELTNAKKTTASSNPGGTFNTKTGILDIPVVDVGLAKTYNVQMQKRATGFIFDLVKAKKNK